MAIIKLNPIPELTQEDIDRFWSKVQKTDHPDGCWIWTGAKSPKGYGFFKVKKRMLKAHRVGYFLATGVYPLDKFCLHTCDVPSCVRNSHIFLGSQQDNIDDMRRKGRAPVGDKHGRRTHPEVIPRGDDHWSRKQPERWAKVIEAANSSPNRARGERMGMAKMTDAKVIELRKLYAEGNHKRRELMDMFGIKATAMYSIIKRETWKHLP